MRPRPRPPGPALPGPVSADSLPPFIRQQAGERGGRGGSCYQPLSLPCVFVGVMGSRWTSGRSLSSSNTWRDLKQHSRPLVVVGGSGGGPSVLHCTAVCCYSVPLAVCCCGKVMAGSVGSNQVLHSSMGLKSILPVVQFSITLRSYCRLRLFHSTVVYQQMDFFLFLTEKTIIFTFLRLPRYRMRILSPTLPLFSFSR